LITARAADHTELIVSFCFSDRWDQEKNDKREKDKREKEQVRMKERGDFVVVSTVGEGRVWLGKEVVACRQDAKDGQQRHRESTRWKREKRLEHDDKKDNRRSADRRCNRDM